MISIWKHHQLKLFLNKRTRLFILPWVPIYSPRPFFLTTLEHELWIYFTFYNFPSKGKTCDIHWILHCERCTNFKHRLPTKYWTIQHETNCSNSPINTAFRRGIIHICQLFHCKAYFDKPQTATLNYIFRLGENCNEKHGLWKERMSSK